MSDQPSRYRRLRYAATGALAALGAVGAIAGATALAAKPHAGPHRYVKPASGGTTKTRASAPQQAGSPQLFVNAIHQLVDNGTITAAQGQVVDAQIDRGYFDSSTLTGFSQSQIQAVQQTLSDTKRTLGPATKGTPP
jgi:hypothetical protein